MFNIPQVFSRLQRKRFLNRTVYYIFLCQDFLFIVRSLAKR